MLMVFVLQGDAATSILESAATHPSLIALDLSANRLSEKGFMALAQLISRSPRIIRIDIDNNPIPSSWCVLLCWSPRPGWLTHLSQYCRHIFGDIIEQR